MIQCRIIALTTFDIYQIKYVSDKFTFYNGLSYVIFSLTHKHAKTSQIKHRQPEDFMENECFVKSMRAMLANHYQLFSYNYRIRKI